MFTTFGTCSWSSRQQDRCHAKLEDVLWDWPSNMSVLQAELPKPKGGLNGILRISPTKKGAAGETARYRPNERICAVLNDIREARNRQSELASIMRSSVPGAWWGTCPAGSMHLGDHLKMSQVRQHIPSFYSPESVLAT